MDGVLFNAAGTELVAYPNGRQLQYVVPVGTQIIGEAAFRLNSALTLVTL